MRRLWPLVMATTLCLAVSGPATPAAAQAKGKKAPAKEAPAAAAPAVSASPPEVVIAGIRVTGSGYGDNRKELRPFNEEPGIALALALKMPAGSALIKLDEDDCKLASIADDTGLDLLENGRYGSFPKTAEDGSAGMIEIESKLRPAAGAQFITAEGTLVFTASTGTKPVKIAKIKLEKGYVMKVGTGTITIGDIANEDGKQSIALTTTRPVLDSIKDVRFLDAAGTALDAHRTERGYIGENASVVYSIATATKPVAFEFLVWQTPKQQSLPYKIKANLSLR
jgi:hypothetical protein